MSDKLLIRFGAPTLAGLKTGSLFTCAYETAEEMTGDLGRWNRILKGKGLRVLPLRYREGIALIYLYRPGRLSRDLRTKENECLLRELGYTVSCADACVTELMRRLRSENGFPHEIGLFLSYPAEDVRGFMQHKGAGCKCVGDWKVYGDVAHATEQFRKYKKCTEVYRACHARGTPLQRLAVAG